jgi:hypothetical protein
LGHHPYRAPGDRRMNGAEWATLVTLTTGTGILMDSPSSIILPAKNEAGNLGPVLAQLAGRFPTAEILVVDDGSTDATASIARAQGARVISHPYSL